MAIAPCSVCGQRFLGKAATMFVAWYPSPQQRTAYKLVTDCDHAMDLLESIAGPIQKSDAPLDSCPMCGSAYTDGISAVYATVYLPNQPRIDFEWPMCEDCRIMACVPFVEHGTAQESRGPSTSPSTPPAVDERLSARLAAIRGL